MDAKVIGFAGRSRPTGAVDVPNRRIGASSSIGREVDS